MCSIISTDERHGCGDYTELLNYLNDIPFEATLPLDMNRVEDGVALRYRFASETGLPQAVIAHELDVNEASVLEVMVALAIRCEEHIMSDYDIGNRTGFWFWEMVRNLDLKRMSDYYFEEGYVSQTLNRLFRHEYSKDGKGGLFCVPGCQVDMRKIEIWYQMCLYLISIT